MLSNNLSMENESLLEEGSANDSLEFLRFLSAIRSSDSENLKKIKFKGEKYSYPIDSKKPEYKLKKLSDNKVEICEILYDSEEILIPDRIDEKIVVGIGEKACFGKLQLKSLILSNKIEYIEPGAFANCINLKNIKWSSKLRVIGDCIDMTDESPLFFKKQYLGAFSYSAIENIDLPESLEIIGENTFRGCKNLKKVKLPSKIKKIARYCFYSCSKLEQIIFSHGVTEIENGAFYGCKFLNSVDLPESIRKIKHFAFQQCINLSDINLNDGLKEIGMSTFRGCKKLKKVIIPKTVSSVHKYSFESNILIE